MILALLTRRTMRSIQSLVVPLFLGVETMEFDTLQASHLSHLNSFQIVYYNFCNGFTINDL